MTAMRLIRGFAGVGLFAFVFGAVLMSVPEPRRDGETVAATTGLSIKAGAPANWAHNTPYTVVASFSGTGSYSIDDFLDAYIAYTYEEVKGDTTIRTAVKWELIKAVTDTKASTITLTFMAKCPFLALHTASSSHPVPKTSVQAEDKGGGKLPIVVNFQASSGYTTAVVSSSTVPTELQ